MRRPSSLNVGMGDAVDAFVQARFLRADDWTKAYSEVVWSWRRDAGAKSAGDFPAGDGGKKARSPGRARSKP